MARICGKQRTIKIVLEVNMQRSKDRRNLPGLRQVKNKYQEPREGGGGGGGGGGVGGGRDASHSNSLILLHAALISLVMSHKFLVSSF